MAAKIRFMLLLVFVTIVVIVIGCSSPEEQGFTLKNMQDIGFQTEKDITKQYWKFQDLSEAWEGNITVNGESKFLGGLIFEGKTIDGFPLTNLPLKSASVENVAVACEEQKVCDYVTENLK